MVNGDRSLPKADDTGASQRPGSRQHRIELPDNQRDQSLADLVARVAEELADLDPQRIAERSAVAYDAETREFTVPVYGKLLAVRYPTLEAREVSNIRHDNLLWFRALLAHYFRTADGFPLSGRWVTLRDLPGGLLYERTFQGYSGNALARGFHPDFYRLIDLAAPFGAQPMTVGDVSFSLTVLPRVPVAVVCYQGDDEQPSTSQFLFDAASTHYVPTDALASIGGRLTRDLLRAGGVT